LEFGFSVEFISKTIRDSGNPTKYFWNICEINSKAKNCIKIQKDLSVIPLELG
jgi:hypothetical protein